MQKQYEENRQSAHATASVRLCERSAYNFIVIVS